MAGSNAGVGGIYNHVNFNLYHYAGNNPVKYIDPTGRASLELGLGLGVAGKIKIGHNNNKWEFSWRIGFGYGFLASIDFNDESFTGDNYSSLGIYIEGNLSLDSGEYSLGVDSQIGIEGVISVDGSSDFNIQNDANVSITYGGDVTAGISVDNGVLEITPPSFDTERAPSLGVDGMIFAGFGGSGVLKEDE